MAINVGQAGNGRLLRLLLGVIISGLLFLAGAYVRGIEQEIGRVAVAQQAGAERITRLETTYAEIQRRLEGLEHKVDRLLERRR